MNSKIVRLSLFLVFSICMGRLPAQTISTVAGNGITGFTGDGVLATTTGMDRPWAVNIDAAGNLYVADRNDQRIRKVSTLGFITTFAGVGSFGFSGDGAAATNAQLYDPSGMAFDAAGNLYVADYSNHRVRKINTAGVISTVAGIGTPGFTTDGIPATNSELNGPKGVAVDAAGNIYIADYWNTRVRKVNSAGIISTIAGDGTFGHGGDGGAATAAQLFYPNSVAVDASGNVFLADENSHRIRKVNTAGIISNYAGDGIPGFFGDGGPATAAELNTPNGITLDGAGNLYFADMPNQRIRKITTAGIISTVAGSGTLGFFGDGGPATAAFLSVPSGVAVDPVGNIFIADQFNDRIRKVNNIAPITGVTGICVGSLSTLSDATGGGTWSSSNTTVATIGLTSGTVSGLSAGTSVITYKVTSGSVFTTVTVIAAPVAGVITGPSTICIGTPVSFSDATPAGAWSSSNTLLATVSSTGLVTPLVTGTVIIQYTVTNICGAALGTKTVSIGTLSAGTITGPSSACVGFSVSLSDAVSGGAWSASNTSASVTSTGLVTGLSGGVDTIIYSVTGSCGTAVATHLVSINVFPSVAAIAGPTNVCIGTSVAFSDATPGGAWTGTNVHSFISSGGLVTGLSTGTDVIVYTVTNLCGSASATATITVGPPSAGTITGTSSVCIGSFIAMSDATAGGVWSISNGSAVISPGGVVTPVFAGADTIIYTVTSACGTASASKTISIITPPAPGSITGAGSICVGLSTPMSDAAPGGVWSVTNSSAFVTTVGLVIGLVAGIDTVVYTVSNACGTLAASKTVTVNPAPAAGVITGASAVCTGASVLLSDAAPGGFWSVSNGRATVSSVGLVTGISPGADSVYYTVTNTCGSVRAQYVVTVNTVPLAGTITGPGNVCIGLTATMSDGVSGGVWSCANANASVTPGGIVTGVIAGTDIISYTVSNSCGAAHAITSITVSIAPAAGTIVATATNPCIGTTVALTDAIGGGVWSSSDSLIAKVSKSGIVTGMALGIATISYSVTGAGGCVNAASVVVTVGGTFPSAVALPAGSAPLCNNTPVVLYVVSSGGPLSYQWIRNGSVIPGATSVSYSAAINGDYSVLLSNGICSETLAGTTVLPKMTPVISFTPPNTLYTSLFTTYEWYLNGHFIPGATTSSIKALGSGSYTVAVLDANLCHDTSAVYNYLVDNVPAQTIASQVKVYPNPATNQLIIDAPVKVSVVVLSMDGRVLMQQHDNVVDVTALVPGLYMAKIYDEQNSMIGAAKFVKAIQ